MNLKSRKEIVDFLALVRSTRAQYEHQKDKDNQLERIAWYNIIRSNKTILEWILGFNNDYPEWFKQEAKSRNLK